MTEPLLPILINLALAFGGMRETEILMTATLEGDDCCFYPPRLYISREAAERLSMHAKLRVLDIQDGDAIAFDPEKRTTEERRAVIESDLRRRDGSGKLSEIIDKILNSQRRVAK